MADVTIANKKYKNTIVQSGLDQIIDNRTYVGSIIYDQIYTNQGGIRDSIIHFWFALP